MKIFKGVCWLLGLISMLIVPSGCDDGECCTYDYFGTTVTYCENKPDEWKGHFSNWSQVKDFAEGYGGHCYD